MTWGRSVRVLAAAVLLAAGCGGEDSSPPAADPADSPPAADPADSPPAADPADSPPSSEVTVPLDPATSSAPTAPSSIDPPAVEMIVLRSDGLGPVDFGTPADDAIDALSAVLGPPDRVETIAPIGPGGDGCVEGAGWLDCLRESRLIDEGRLVVWESHGLEVAMVDTAHGTWPRERTSLQFGDWHATIAPGDAHLLTEDGLYPGMTVGDLRLAAPWVDFHYGEGVLSGFSVTFGANGGYGGRLDWDPSTAEIEWHDVAAMQAALNDHGADLVVDGVWGPRSQAAWRAFLSDRGIELPAGGAMWPLWLTPDIGTSLGLPPDNITVASLVPRPVMETAASTVPLPILRADGLGEYDFGEPVNELIPKLEALLGPPSNVYSETPDGPGPFEYLPQGYHAAYELRIVTWDALEPAGVGDRPDFQVVLSDVPYLGGHDASPTPGTLTLITWITDSPRFRLGTGIGVGSTVAELRVQHLDVQFGTYSVCEDPYDPASFDWHGLHGTFDWDWVSDLQRALNERGAELVVDGEYGQRTAASVAALQQELDLDGSNGWIGPETIDALGLSAPDGARITLLLGGSRGTC